jgi:hypothetical protein
LPTYADLMRHHRESGLDPDTVLRLTEEEWQTWPVRLAEARGHTPAFDAVRGERWTCTTCSRAVLRVGGNVYGRAIEEDCDEGETR